MKEFIGLDKERIDFLKNLTVQKQWKIEQENVLKGLEHQELQVKLEFLWRAIVLEWNSWEIGNSIQYFINCNPKTVQEKVLWYHALSFSSHCGNVLLVNQVSKDLTNFKDFRLVSTILKFLSRDLDSSFLYLLSLVEKLLDNSNVEIRICATRAYFAFYRLKTLDYTRILRKLTDVDLKVTSVALMGIREFSLYNTSIPIQDALLHILVQIKDKIFLQVRVLQILEKLRLKKDQIDYIVVLKRDLPDFKDKSSDINGMRDSRLLQFHVERVLISQGIYDFEGIKDLLESREQGRERIGLILVDMLPVSMQMDFKDQVSRLKESKGLIIQKLCFKILSTFSNDLQDLTAFFRFWQNYKDIMSERDNMDIVKNWISRSSWSDLDKFKRLLYATRILKDESRLEYFDLLMSLFEILEGTESLLVLEAEINLYQLLENNISRFFLGLLEKISSSEILLKIMVDCVYRCSESVLQDNFVSLIKAKVAGTKLQNENEEINRLFNLDTTDEFLLKVIYFILTFRILEP